MVGSTEKRENDVGKNASLFGFVDRKVESVDEWNFEEVDARQRLCGSWLRNHGLPAVLDGELFDTVCPLCGARRVESGVKHE